jgi:hypothetical protein
MTGRERTSIAALAVFWAVLEGIVPAAAQSTDEDLKVYSDAPRLLLTKQRLRLLQREKDRDSARWQQFDSLITGGATLPEPGFAWALHYKVTGQAGSARKAIEWALSAQGTDLRQLAFVYDWSAPVLTMSQTGQLAQKIQRALQSPAADSAAAQDARALAAIAVADSLPDQGEKILKTVVDDWWQAKRLKNLQSGRLPFAREETYSVYELFHVLRDNTKIDLRENNAEYFQKFPLDHLASHYPPPFTAPEGEYRVPAYTANGEPDLNASALSRAAELAMVAYDSNDRNVQFVQGWLMDDHYVMRSALGAPYEFLWANPYQPGLSYEKLPLFFHDAKTGRVFARTSWEDDATWIGYFDGQLQMYRDGKVQVLKSGAAMKPVRVGEAMLLTAPPVSQDGTRRLTAECETVVLFGLSPNAHYDVEVDDQELWDEQTDAGGTLVVSLPAETQPGIRIRPRN